MAGMNLRLRDLYPQQFTSEIARILHLDHRHPNLATETAAKMLKNYNRKPRKQRPAKQNKIPRAHYVLISGKLVRVEERK